MTQTTAGHFLVRVYADSLALPRPESGIAYFETYPELYAEAMGERRSNQWVSLFSRARAGITIGQLAAECKQDSQYFQLAGGERAILQCGIVDCAPRILTEAERSFVDNLRPKVVRTFILRVLHRYRPKLIRRRGQIVRLTDPSRFFAIYEQWLGQIVKSVARTYVVNISPVTEEMEARSPGVRASIESYNALIEAASLHPKSADIRLVDVHGAIQDSSGGVNHYVDRSDGHHLTREGHQLYARLLLDSE